MLGQKYSAVQRRFEIPQISLDLQAYLHNRIFKIASIMSLLPSISLEFIDYGSLPQLLGLWQLISAFLKYGKFFLDIYVTI